MTDLPSSTRITLYPVAGTRRTKTRVSDTILIIPDDLPPPVRTVLIGPGLLVGLLTIRHDAATFSTIPNYICALL